MPDAEVRRDDRAARPRRSLSVLPESDPRVGADTLSVRRGIDGCVPRLRPRARALRRGKGGNDIITVSRADRVTRSRRSRETREKWLERTRAGSRSRRSWTHSRDPAIRPLLEACEPPPKQDHARAIFLLLLLVRSFDGGLLSYFLFWHSPKLYIRTAQI